MEEELAVSDIDIADPKVPVDDSGWLDVGDGHELYWEVSGNREGSPAVVLHGGPGAGFDPKVRGLFDPKIFRLALFDQRNCGKSRPHAGAPEVDLSQNTTPHLVSDIERLREHLGVKRWLVLGGSWGTTLALAYAKEHPDRVSALVLCGVTAGRRSEFDWLFRGGVARLFPKQWEAFTSLVPDDPDVVAGYYRMLFDPDPTVRARACRAWCMWESVNSTWPPRETLDPYFADPEFALAFCRIVTHYVVHDAWLPPDPLTDRAEVLAAIPGALINGSFDLQTPPGNAWDLKRVWPKATLRLIDNAGHNPFDSAAAGELKRAVERFAASGAP